MPGPKMGPRPADFDEEIVKQSPTFLKWLSLSPGQKLKYACREFTKGEEEEEERLMRRIMIARRNNVRDHEALKKARRIQKRGATTEEQRRKTAAILADHVVEREMDASAVEATRSYRRWMDLPEGGEFVYNQRYIKGKEGHDWLLKKNIWRRMRYRRENKKMVEKLKQVDSQPPVPHRNHPHPHLVNYATAAAPTTMSSATGSYGFDSVAGTDVDMSTDSRPMHPSRYPVETGGTTPDEAAMAAAAAAAVDHLADQVAIEAAVAAAVNFGKEDTTISMHHGDHHHIIHGQNNERHHDDDDGVHDDVGVASHPGQEAMEHTHLHDSSHHHHGRDEAGDNSALMVHDPLQAAAAQAALDAAAKLAAVTHPESLHGHDREEDDNHHVEDDGAEGDDDDDEAERFLLSEVAGGSVDV